MYKNTLKLVNKTSLLRYSNARFVKCYSTSSNQSNNKKTNHFLPLSILGLAAIGLTYYNMDTIAKPPVSAIDPTKATPIFAPDEINVIFVLGGPGAGKGTQCANLVRDYKFVHLSAGDLLRAEQNKPDSKDGAMIKRYIKEGLIVPQEVTIKLLQNAITEEFKNGKKNFLIDGFPRKMDQAISFQNQIAIGKAVLFFDCPEKVMLERLLNRGKTSGRADDNIESIKKRFKTFIDTSLPVVNYFEDHDKVIKVSCDEPVDQVYKNVVNELKNKNVI